MANNRELSQFASNVGHNGGNIGIGTDNPLQTLHLSDTTSANIYLQTHNAGTGSTAGVYFRTSDSSTADGFFKTAIVLEDDGTSWARGQLHFLQNSTADASNATLDDSVLVINNNGNIGIGTVTPTGPIHAHAASGTQRSYLEASASHSFLRLKSGSTSYNSGIEFFSGASNIANVNGLGAGGLQFEVNGSERLRITSGGRVAIGTDNPGSVLDIQRAAAGSEQMLQIRSHATAAGDFDGDYSVEIRHATSTVTHGMLISNKETQVSRRTLDIADGNGVFATFTNGKLGINRTNPDQRLNVNGNIEVNAYDNTGGGGGYTTSSGLIIGNLYDAGKSYTGSDDRTACIWQERGLDLDFATNDTLKMKITYDGKVGIGTNVPARLLHLHESNSNEALITFTTPTTGVTASDGFRVGMNGSEEALVWNNENGIIKFGTNNTERLRITGAGILRGGSANSTSGSTLIENKYSDEDILNVIGSMYSTGNLSLGYGLRPKSGGTGYTSSFDNFSGKRAALQIGQGSFDFLATASASSTTVGNDIGTTVRMRIEADGKFYYATTSQGPHGGFFNIDGSSGGQNAINVKGTTANYVMVSSAGGSSGDHIYFSNYSNSNQETGRIKDNQSNVTYYTSSDYRLKDNIVSITDGITRVKQLNPVRHTWINNPALGTVDGWIAHELDEVCPDAVDGEKDAVREDGSIKAQAADYGRITPLLAAALKEAIAKIETLESQHADLLARVTALEGS